MPTSTSLVHPLTTGAAATVLVVEFQAWTTAPRLSRLVAERAHGHPVLQVDPVGALSGERTYLSIEELAAQCVEEALALGLAPGQVFVAGHCSAAALSLRIAALLEETHDVTAVLVGPSWPDEENVQHRFGEALAGFRAPAQDCPPLTGDPTTAVAAMSAVLQEALDALAEASGVSSSAAAFTELLTWHRGWLAFLLACHVDPTTGWDTSSADVLVLARTTEGDHVPGLAREEYAVCHAPVLHEQDPITPELADHVVEQVLARAARVATPA